LKDWRIFLADY